LAVGEGVGSGVGAGEGKRVGGSVGVSVIVYGEGEAVGAGVGAAGAEVGLAVDFWGAFDGETVGFDVEGLLLGGYVYPVTVGLGVVGETVGEGVSGQFNIVDKSEFKRSFSSATGDGRTHMSMSSPTRQFLCNFWLLSPQASLVTH